MEMTTVKNIPALQQNVSSGGEHSLGTGFKNSDGAVTLQRAQTTSNRPEGANSLSPQEQKERLAESAKKFNELSDSLNLDIKFAYNDKIDQVYLNVIDKNTGKVIRKLPSEEAMKISESMKDLVGALLDKKG